MERTATRFTPPRKDSRSVPAMKFEQLVFLLPCHGLEDFQLDRDADQAEQLLTAWSALWHPALLECRPDHAAMGLGRRSAAADGHAPRLRAAVLRAAAAGRLARTGRSGRGRGTPQRAASRGGGGGRLAVLGAYRSAGVPPGYWSAGVPPAGSGRDVRAPICGRDVAFNLRTRRPRSSLRTRRPRSGSRSRRQSLRTWWPSSTPWASAIIRSRCSRGSCVTRATWTKFPSARRCWPRRPTPWPATPKRPAATSSRPATGCTTRGSTTIRSRPTCST